MNLKEILSRIERCLSKPEKNPKDIRVVIDPGHGGKDAGAIKDNLKEKDINLEVAVRLAWLCSRHKIGFILTRFGNRFISLNECCKRANTTKAELFISIHCNSFKDEKVKGIETFYCGGSAKGKILAKRCQQLLMELKYSKDRESKHASFYVLKHTRMTAILIELGFISNPEDAFYLDNENNQMLIAEKIFEFIKEVV